jgi:hypothetical protein
MSRNSILLRVLAVITLAAALLSAAAAPAPEAGTLMLDGKLDVEEGDLSGAIISVYKDDAPMQEITEGLRHFALELELGHTYLLSFAKPGCVTKELLLDAHTPEHHARSYFSFLFQVTLKAGKADYAYDAPVAIIHFDADEQGFNYDRMRAKPRLVPSAEIKAQLRSRARKQVRPFEDPASTLAAWVEEKRNAQ